MHEFVVFNHEIIPAEESFLSAISAAALYGKGIFTTVSIYDEKPFLWEKHSQRLTTNAEKVGVDFSAFSQAATENSLLDIIRKNNLTNGRARLTFFDETASRIWQSESNSKTSFLIQTASFRAVPKNFRLTVSPFAVNSKSPLANVKSCNYLENILALEDAAKNGFDEAVRFNERGEIASAATANIFWTENEKIYTPSLETGCLAGTAREFICEKFSVAKVKTDLTKLFDADEIFLTSAGIGVVQVSEFQDRKLPREPHYLIQSFAEMRAK